MGKMACDHATLDQHNMYRSTFVGMWQFHHGSGKTKSGTQKNSRTQTKNRQGQHRKDRSSDQNETGCQAADQNGYCKSWQETATGRKTTAGYQ